MPKARKASVAGPNRRNQTATVGELWNRMISSLPVVAESKSGDVLWRQG